MQKSLWRDFNPVNFQQTVGQARPFSINGYLRAAKAEWSVQPTCKAETVRLDFKVAIDGNRANAARCFWNIGFQPVRPTGL
jgi:hypothetical protein